MEYIVAIRFPSETPSHYNRLKSFLVNKFVYKNRPLEDSYIYFYTYILKPSLNDFRCHPAQLVTLVCEDRKFETHSVFIEPSVLVSILPAGFLQYRACGARVKGIRLYVFVKRPRFRNKLTRTDPRLPQKNPVDYFLFIDGII